MRKLIAIAALVAAPIVANACNYGGQAVMANHATQAFNYGHGYHNNFVAVPIIASIVTPTVATVQAQVVAPAPVVQAPVVQQQTAVQAVVATPVVAVQSVCASPVVAISAFNYGHAFVNHRAAVVVGGHRNVVAVRRGLFHRSRVNVRVR